MQEFIALSIGVLVGGFLGFNAGVERIVDKAEVAAQNFIDALRAAGVAAYKRISATASPELAIVFREITGA